MNFYGAVRVSQPGTNHQSRKLRAAGKIAEAEVIEARCKIQHENYLNKGWIHAKGCGRYRNEECKCSKCKKL